MLEMATQSTPNEISVAAKERLARLLATENVTVEHRDVPTAAFDIKNRVLVLPNWKDITKDIYDLLVLHEVGHALWTPLEGWHHAITGKGPNFRGFLNVLEDCRIEKKIKRKFPGGRKSFTRGYKELLDRDFFGLTGRDANDLNFIDRINIHFKGGQAMGIRFNDLEQTFIDRIEDAETWEQVEAIANDLWDLMSQDAPETDVNPGPGGPSDDSDGEQGEDEGSAPGLPGDDDSDDDDSDGEFGETPFGDDAPEGTSETDDDAPGGAGDGDEDGEDSEGSGSNDDADTDTDGNADSDGSGDDDNSDSDSGSGSSKGSDGEDSDTPSDSDTSGDNAAGRGNGGDGSFGGEPFSETDKAFRDKEETLVDSDASSPVYVQIPKDEAFDLDAIIIPNTRVVKALKAAAREHEEDALTVALGDLKKFKNTNSKVVNYLAKEFEMRKAADASARATSSRTGVLDVNSLHSYKWNDDVFKKITNIPDGKSHGLQMFVDWSGSMSSNMFGSLDQILNLVLFCRKVNIPFDVYAFSDCADRGQYDDETGRRSFVPRMDKNRLETGDLSFRKSNFKLVQLATSKGKTAAFNDMLLGLIILRGHFNHYGHYGNPTEGTHFYNIPRWMGLGGTPLNEAIMTSIPVINKFRAENGLQIVNSAFLTDGQGCNVYDAHNLDRYSRWGGNIIIRDRKSRKEFLQNDNQMAILLEIARIRTGAKVVNFYVSGDRPQYFKNEWMRAAPMRDGCMYDEDGAVEAYKVAKAEGGIAIEDSPLGWDALYLLMGGSSLVVSDEGLSDDLVGAKKGTLKRAFGKAASGKLRCRVVLRKFTELIAA